MNPRELENLDEARQPSYSEMYDVLDEARTEEWLRFVERMKQDDVVRTVLDSQLRVVGWLQVCRAELARLFTEQQAEQRAAKRLRWLPKDGDRYFCIDSTNCTLGTNWTGSEWNVAHYNNHNCFQTRKAAERAKMTRLAWLELCDAARRMNDGKEYGGNVSTIESDDVFGLITCSRREIDVPYGAPFFIDEDDASAALADLSQRDLIRWLSPDMLSGGER